MNFIHHTAIVDPKAKIGLGVVIGPHAIIMANVKIGDGCLISPFAVIGSPAEKRGFFEKLGSVEIGKNCVIREYVTVNGGTFRPTVVGDNCILLRGSHVGHDAIIQDNVTLSCNVLVGGEALVMEGSNLGLGVSVHQGMIIGPYSIVGMNAAVSKKTPILPFSKYAGVPARELGMNTVAIQRNNLSKERMTELSRLYNAAVDERNKNES